MNRNDYILVESLVNKYRRSFREEHYGGMWKGIFEAHHRQLHEVFMRGEIEGAAKILRDPCSSYLHYGFDQTVKGFQKEPDGNTQLLIDLSIAVGAERLPNPEYAVSSWRLRLRNKLKSLEPAETILSRIDAKLGRIEFPNPFPGEGGISTKRGRATYRAVHAIYQASLLRGRVVEIGGGLGRTAYYAQCFGVKDYTIVDLPFTGISQGFFLGTVLPSHTVKLISPDEFFASSDTYDVAFNADSLTEVGIETAKKYAHAIKARADGFISINHEANRYTVRELLGEPRVRCPYWLRDGYVEEHY